MTQFGSTLMTEQSGPKDPVREPIVSEARGFDFVFCRGHFLAMADDPNAGIRPQRRRRQKVMAT
jgi:hypothetical protein